MTRRVPAAAALLLVVACSDAPPQRSLEPHAAPQHMSFANSEWSEPVHLPAPVNSAARELGAALSPDELSLYFGSDRAGGFGAIDIWVSHRACTACPWDTPVNLGAGVNSQTGDGGPALSHDGLLLFFSGGDRPGGQGSDDIWVSRRTDPNDDFSWGPAVNLGPDVNAAANEESPAYVPALGAEGASLYFLRGGAIYRARVTRDGETLGPAVPVAELNSTGAVAQGLTVRADGREIFFSSTRAGGLGGADIWVATRRSPHDPWSPPQNLGSVINTSAADLTPGLSWDGRTLLFSAAATARPGLGLQDIWMATRSPNPQ